MSLLHQSPRPIALTQRGVCSVIAAAALCWFGSALAFPPATLAGQYHVESCTDSVTHAPLPSEGWAETAGDSAEDASTCETEGGLIIATNPQFPDTTSSWTFTAPPETTIKEATLYREGYMSSKARSFWAAPENAESDDFDLCQGGPENSYCYLGNVFVDKECKAPGLCGSMAYTPNDTLVVPSNHLPAHKLAFDVDCLAQGCNGFESLRSANIDLQQTVGPTAVATDGSLMSATTISGTVDIEITASDPASGIFQAILQSNGNTVAKQIIDVDGGKCQPYGEEPDGSQIFLYTQPCPQVISDIDVPFDNAKLPDGPQQLTVLVSDAAGNTTSILSRNVTVDDSGEYLVKIQHEQQEKALAARGTCNAECDDHASIHAANARLSSRPFSRTYARSNLSLDGQLLDHTGSPMKGAVVELRQQPTDLGSKAVSLATTTTDAKGNWKFLVPKGPSRILTVGYRSRSNDPTFATQVQFHETVAAGVKLSAPKRVHPGVAFIFRGNLAGGYIPRGGALVSLEIYYGGEWREIALLHTNRLGHFHYRYTFAEIGVSTFRFRAQTPAIVGYPFAAGASPATHIHLSSP